VFQSIIVTSTLLFSVFTPGILGAGRPQTLARLAVAELFDLPLVQTKRERWLSVAKPNPQGTQTMSLQSPFTRRHFLGGMALGVAAFSAPGAFAEELIRTPAQTEGPFYPDKLPLDTDNDLLIINDKISPAVGEVTHLGGRILDANGNPVRNALVEIWQVDNNGAYLHSGTNNRDRRDTNFQGFGRFMTGSSGEYYFRTIKPVPYPGRTPHIHFAVKLKGRDKFTTQCYIKGHPGNERDGIWRGIRDPKARDSVTIDFAPIKQSKIGELSAKFDIVMGFTPEV
jgi:protocatechuate 3,4-dioxygenase, beta subunit